MVPTPAWTAALFLASLGQVPLSRLLRPRHEISRTPSEADLFALCPLPGSQSCFVVAATARRRSRRRSWQAESARPAAARSCHLFSNQRLHFPRLFTAPPVPDHPHPAGESHAVGTALLPVDEEPAATFQHCFTLCEGRGLAGSFVCFLHRSRAGLPGCQECLTAVGHFGTSFVCIA